MPQVNEAQTERVARLLAEDDARIAKQKEREKKEQEKQEKARLIDRQITRLERMLRPLYEQYYKLTGICNHPVSSGSGEEYDDRRFCDICGKVIGHSAD